jgi:hypothetical protein
VKYLKRYKMKGIIHNALIVLTGALILMIISLFNGYPLVYSDTATYIYSGFDKFIPMGRPITYGLFIYLFSFKISLWFVVIVQNLITAYIIFEICRLLIERSKLTLYYLVITLFLTFFTGIGWYSNQIMPDMFAPLFFLLVFLLLYSPKMSFWKYFAYSVLLIVSLVVHFSHILLVIAITIIVIAIEYPLARKGKPFTPLFPMKRILIVIGLIISAWIILPTINYLTEKKFIVSTGSHVFLMAHLADTGILEKFLKENCDKEEYRNCSICKYKDSIPTNLSDFMWESNGVLAKTGGWADSKEQYDKIVRGMLRDPKYLTMNILKSFTYGCHQLFKNDIGQGLTANTASSGNAGQIKWRFPYELNNFLNCKQNQWNGVYLNFKTINIFNLILNILSLFCLLFIFFTPLWKKINTTTLKFLIYSLIAILVNSFITAGLNSPTERFQARVVWMLPMALLIILFTEMPRIKETMRDLRSGGSV